MTKSIRTAVKKAIDKLPVRILACAAASLLAVCGGSQTNAQTDEKSVGTYRAVSGKEARKLFENSGALIVDVRGKTEYDERHVKGAVLLPLDKIETTAQSVLTDKNCTVILYCRSGKRSKTAAGQLLTLGYKNVYDMGGINNWTGEFGP